MLSLLLLLVCLPFATSKCNKIHPFFLADAIPPFVGSTGPFGTVCEVKSPADFPVVPAAPPVNSTSSKVWQVRSHFPDTFMEVVMPSVGRTAKKSV